MYQLETVYICPFYDCLFSPFSFPLSLFPFSESRSFLYVDIFLLFNICNAIVLTFFYSLINSFTYSFNPFLSISAYPVLCDPLYMRSFGQQVGKHGDQSLLDTADVDR